MSEMDTTPSNANTDAAPQGPEEQLASVRFQEAGKAYHFLAAGDLELQPGDWVVVETVYGDQAGQLVSLEPLTTALPEDIRPLKRRASGLDMARYHVMQERAERMLDIAVEEIGNLETKEAIKAVYAELTLNGKQALISYMGNLSNKERAQLRRRLSSRMRCRVELRFVGPRDHAKHLGGYGVCGEPRCCARFLTEFQAVSIRMAKDQSISMSPTDITGMCGRLRCCLGYEHQVYQDASKGFPKRKSWVETENGVGRVIDWDVLKGEVIVEIPPDGPRHERERFRFPVESVKDAPRKN